MRTLKATKYEHSLNVNDVAVPGYIFHLTQIVCNHLRYVNSVKYELVRALTNLKLQNSAQIVISPPPFLVLPSIISFLHEYARVFITHRD